TRFDCDWSSDVCSSDLVRTLVEPRLRRQVGRPQVVGCAQAGRRLKPAEATPGNAPRGATKAASAAWVPADVLACAGRLRGPRARSEERRVGEEGRSEAC